MDPKLQGAPVSKGPFQPGDQWVAEKRLPLWLIKAFEEAARRAGMAAAADAARRAARGETCWGMSPRKNPKTRRGSKHPKSKKRQPGWRREDCTLVHHGNKGVVGVACPRC